MCEFNQKKTKKVDDGDLGGGGGGHTLEQVVDAAPENESVVPKKK